MANTELKDEVVKKTSTIYDPALVDRASESALKLEAMDASRPSDYSSKYQPQIDMAMDKVLNRPKFDYNVNEDALYQQYKDRYTQSGRTAMQDTMGQAAALTGGYGSTYGQRVGQQTYDQYMQGLTDKIPELYQLAQDKYDREYAYDKDRLSVLDSAENRDYGRWGDAMNLWQIDRNYQAGRYDTELGQAMSAADSMYSRLSALIQMGYTPTEDEMRLAGMTADQVAAINGTLKRGSGGSGGGSKPKPADTSWIKDAMDLSNAGYGDVARDLVSEVYKEKGITGTRVTKRGAQE